MKSALLFRLGGLGDLLVAFPSIYLMRKSLFPCYLTLVCRQEYGLILKETGVVDSIVSADEPRLAPLFASPSYPEDITRWLEGFSAILSWMQKRSPLKLEEFCASQNKRRCQSFVYDPVSQSPLSTFFFEKTTQFLASEKSPLPSFSQCSLLPLSPQQKQDGLKLLGELPSLSSRNIAVVHPGSGSKNKCWPLENFLEIIRRLARREFQGALVTGQTEARLESRIEESFLPPGWIWLRNPSLLKLAGLLQASALYLGNDSGITHLAAACGTDVVALFREDLKAPWKPFGLSSILSSESVADISSASVWETIIRITG